MYLDFFKNYYNQNKGLVIGNGVLTICIFPIEIILLSWLSGMIFVAIQDKKMEKFTKYVIVFFIVFMTVLLLYYFSEKLDILILPSLEKSIRSDIYDKLNDNKNGINNFENGEIITKMLKIPEYIFLNFMNFVTFMLPFLFSILFFIFYMFYINWRIGLTSIIFFSIFLITYYIYFNKLCLVSNDRFTIQNSLMNDYEDVLKNNENILLNNTNNFEKQILVNKEKNLQKSLSHELNFLNNVKIIFILSLCLFMLFIIIFCSKLVIKDIIPLYKLIILTTAVLLMVRSFTNLIRRNTDSIIEFGPILKGIEFFNNVNLSKINNGTKKNFLKNYNLEIKNLQYKIGDKTILDDINLKIPYKSSILITGEIGAGKSTLVKILCGYFKVSNEKILFDNIDINDIDIEYLRNNITIMHQNIILFKRSVLENIIYGILPNSEEWINYCNELKNLKIYQNLQKFINVKDATKLSGGQKQIVLLLRCYFRNTKILILDEPTANVDYETKKIIIDIIQLLKKDKTIICISHDQSIWNLFDKHLIMDKGKIINKN